MFLPYIVIQLAIRTNKIHTFYINILIQTHCLLRVSNIKYSSSGRIVHAVFMEFLSCILMSSLDGGRMCSIDLRFRGTDVVAKHREVCNWIKFGILDPLLSTAVKFLCLSSLEYAAVKRNYKLCVCLSVRESLYSIQAKYTLRKPHALLGSNSAPAS